MQHKMKNLTDNKESDEDENKELKI